MRPRYREINIFSTSLIDLLCGALGAFMFLMLALLPYYTPGVPPDAYDAKKEEIEKLQRQLEQKDERIRELEKEVEELKRINEELREQLRKLATGDISKEELARLQDELARLREEIAALREELQKVRTQLEEALRRQRELEQKVLELQTQNRQLTEQNTALMAERVKLLQEIESLKKKIAELMAEIERLKAAQGQIVVQPIPVPKAPEFTLIFHWSYGVDIDIFTREGGARWIGPKQLPWGTQVATKTYDGDYGPMSIGKYESLSNLQKGTYPIFYTYFQGSLPEKPQLNVFLVRGPNVRDLGPIPITPEKDKLHLLGLLEVTDGDVSFRSYQKLLDSQRENLERTVQQNVQNPVADPKLSGRRREIILMEELVAREQQRLKTMSPGAADYDNTARKVERLMEELEAVRKIAAEVTAKQANPPASGATPTTSPALSAPLPQFP